MGIFSTKKKHYVDTAVSRVIPDNRLPDTILSATLRADLLNANTLDVLEILLPQSSTAKFERMFKYGASGDYFYGLPNTTLQLNSTGFELAKEIIEQELNQEVQINYMYFRPMNNIHMAYVELITQYGFNYESNQLTTLERPGGNPVYLEQLVAVHNIDPDAPAADFSVYGNWGQSSTAGETPLQGPIDASTLNDLIIQETSRAGEHEVESVEIHTIWVNETTQVIERNVITLDLSNYLDEEMYQARYTYYYAGETQIAYWTYIPSTGVYPELSNIFNTGIFTESGDYAPFVVFRSDGVNRASEAVQGTEEYNSSVKLLDYLGLDYQQLSDDIHANPDIDQVDQAFMTMGVPLNSTNPLDIEYLFKYIKDLEETSLPIPSTVTVYPGYAGINLATTPGESYAIEIADADFKMNLSFDAINRELITGSIGEVDTYTREIEYGAIEGTEYTSPDEVSLLFNIVKFNHQISEDTYEQVSIYHPVLKYYVHNEYYVQANYDDPRFLIPLDLRICKSFTYFKREKLYTQSLYFVFNSHVVQKVKWYEQEWFSAVLVIVAVVITIMSYGSTASSIGAALSSGAISTAAYLAAEALLWIYVEGLFIELAFSAITDLLGVELTLLVAAFAVVLGSYTKVSGTTLGNLTSTDFIKITSGLVESSSEALKEMFNSYDYEKQEFSALQEEKWKELEEAQDLLTFITNPILTQGLKLVPLLPLGESSDTFYARTIHTGNPGIQSLSIPSEFVNMNLQLPQ